MTIETIADWHDLLHLLRDGDFRLHQMQFGIAEPEGFHASFVAHGRPVLVVVTHSQVVHDAILAFRG